MPKLNSRSPGTPTVPSRRSYYFCPARNTVEAEVFRLLRQAPYQTGLGVTRVRKDDQRYMEVDVDVAMSVRLALPPLISPFPCLLIPPDRSNNLCDADNVQVFNWMTLGKILLLLNEGGGLEGGCEFGGCHEKRTKRRSPKRQRK